MSGEIVAGIIAGIAVLAVVCWLLDWRASKKLERRAWRELTRRK